MNKLFNENTIDKSMGDIAILMFPKDIIKDYKELCEKHNIGFIELIMIALHDYKVRDQLSNQLKK